MLDYQIKKGDYVEVSYKVENRKKRKKEFM